MINKAMFVSRNDLNKFTTALRDRISKKGKPVLCKMRNGDHHEVTYKEANPDEYTDASFHCPNWNYVWNLDGSSITRSDFDLVEF